MRRAIAGFFLGINACASAAASAQQRDTARTDSTKHVTPVRRLDPVVVTNSRATGIDRRVPAQLDDIKLDAVAAGPAAAAEVLRRLPGVNLFDDQGSRLQPELDLRGFTVSPVVGQPQGVSVFLDGVRINEPDAQEVNFDLIPMDAVNRAQLVRGPSAIFGKNSLAATYQSTLHIASALDDEPPATPGDHFPTSPVQRAMAGLEFIRGIARGVLIAAVEVRGVSGQYLRGDEANVQPQLPGYAITDLHARGRLAHGTVRVAVTNLFDRQYVSFGVYARNTKGPISGPVLANPDAAPVERFLTPGQPRRLTLSVSLDR